MTPLWFTDPTKVLHVLAINTESHLYMTSLCSHKSSLYHLKYINNVAHEEHKDNGLRSNNVLIPAPCGKREAGMSSACL